MTIDEAICHAEEVAEEQEELYKLCPASESEILHCNGTKDCKTLKNGKDKGCQKCAEEHRQLAEWLRDYKRLKEQPEITWVTGTDGAKVAFWDVPIPKVLKICEMLQEPTVTPTEDNAEMVYPQVEGITPIVVNEDIYECSCGYGWDKNKTSRFHFCPNCGKAIGDGNDYKYIKSISNPTGIEFDIDIDKKVESYKKLLKHPVVKHIMDEEQEQLDFIQPHKRIPVTLTVSGDLISRQAVLDKFQWHSGDESNKYLTLWRFVENMPSVKPQTGHWIMRHRKVNTINYRTGEDVLTGEIHTVKELIRYETDEPYCACCGKRAEDISQDYCGYCGARMESEDKE